MIERIIYLQRKKEIIKETFREILKKQFLPSFDWDNIDTKDIRGNTALILAALHGHYDLVELLIQNGADINAKDFVCGNTVLIWAVEGGYKEIVELLIENNADINAKDNFDYTALQCATQRGYKEIVELLIQNGADINAKDVCGNTVLSWAIKNDHKEIVNLLKNAANNN